METSACILSAPVRQISRNRREGHTKRRKGHSEGERLENGAGLNLALVNDFVDNQSNAFAEDILLDGFIHATVN